MSFTGAVIARNNFPRFYQYGLYGFFGQQYPRWDEMWSEMFEYRTSKKAFEISSQAESFGYAPEKDEGAPIQYDSIQQGINPQFTHVEYAKGFAVTNLALEDELYGLFGQRAKALMECMMATRELVCANVFNNGFDSDYTMTGGDGQPLFSTAHLAGPTSGLTYANMLTTSSAFCETAFQSLETLMANAFDARGIPINLRPDVLQVSTSGWYEAVRVQNSVLRTNTSNNDVNVINLERLIKKIVRNPYLTSQTAWFVTTDVKDGLIFYDRRPITFEDDNDFNTSNVLMKAAMRFSVGWNQGYGCYASGNAG